MPELPRRVFMLAGAEADRTVFWARQEVTNMVSHPGPGHYILSSQCSQTVARPLLAETEEVLREFLRKRGK